MTGFVPSLVFIWFLFLSKKITIQPKVRNGVIAGGLGLTLTRAHNMIICDYDWTPSNMVQVEDRICRSGQTVS